MKIAILCGGPSSEHEVSVNSAQAIEANINKSKYDISIFYITRQNKAYVFETTDEIKNVEQGGGIDLLEGISRYLVKMDVALLAALHGEFVEDGKIQTLLEYYNVAYTGSGPEASSLCMDKYRAAKYIEKELEGLGLSFPKTTLYKYEDQPDYKNLQYPLVYKPNALGSSVGIRIVKNETELMTQILERRDEEYLLQEFVDKALEVSCACLENEDREFTKLPAIEIEPLTSNFFDYEAKYTPGASKETTPPKQISVALANKISELACEIHWALGCKTYSRSDFIVKDDKIYFIETNTLPGMTSTSLVPQEAEAAGISYEELLDFLIEQA